MSKNKFYRDSLIIGFALFAMFFGAGNLIFPPYLGFGSASNWFWGFMAFIATDVGLSIFAIFMIAKLGNGAEGITSVLGEKASLLLLCANTICLGPLIAIPRTAATTFEFAVQPIFPGANSWISAIIFFAVVIALSLRQSKIIDIVGSVLSPIMLLALLLLIVTGIVTPLGSPAEGIPVSTVVRDGIMAGYQTMDMMGAIIFSVAILASILQKGYSGKKEQFKVIAVSGIVAAAALFTVYCGLAFLGASVSSVFPTTYSQSELLIAITSGLLGTQGVVLLGVIVAAACITTAIGLISSASAYFVNVSKGKLSYKGLVIIISVFSCVISNLGISTIISLASPILDLIYPVLLVLTFMAAFSQYLHNNNIYKGAALGALLCSILTLVEKYTGANLGLSFLPLASYGFGWILPSVLGGVIGKFIKEKSKKSLA